MTHHITGLIGKEATFRALVIDRIGKEPRIPLTEDWRFMPLDDKNLEALIGSDTPVTTGNFEYLTPSLINALCAWSVVGDLAYIETDYHGGHGVQGAIVAKNGHVVFGPMETLNGAINAALTILGVLVPSTCLDSFDALDLGRYRSNRDFRLEAR